MTQAQLHKYRKWLAEGWKDKKKALNETKQTALREMGSRKKTLLSLHCLASWISFCVDGGYKQHSQKLYGNKNVMNYNSATTNFRQQIMILLVLKYNCPCAGRFRRHKWRFMNSRLQMKAQITIQSRELAGELVCIVPTYHFLKISGIRCLSECLRWSGSFFKAIFRLKLGRKYAHTNLL